MTPEERTSDMHYSIISSFYIFVPNPIVLCLHIGIASMRQFQYVPTIFV